MPETDKKISALPERVAGSIDGSEEVVAQVGASANYRIKLSSISTWLATLITQFVTLTGIQTLTNKTLTSPAINSPAINGGSALTVTSTVINYLTGITSNINAILSGLAIADSAMDTRISALESGSAGIYSEQSTMLSGVKTISAGTIYAGNIDYTTLLVSYYKRDISSNKWTQQAPETISFQTNGSYLASITFDLSLRTIPEDDASFLFVVRYGII